MKLFLLIFSLISMGLLVGCSTQPVTSSVLVKYYDADGRLLLSRDVSGSVSSQSILTLMSVYSPVSNGLLFHATLDNLNEEISGGTLTKGGSSTSTSSGMIGGAYFFDGSTGTYLSGNPVSINGAVSLEAWVYPTSNVQGYILAQYNSALIQRTSSGTINAGVFSGSTHTWTSLVTTTATVPLNTWTHLVFTYDGVSTARVYINGALSSSNTAAGSHNIIPDTNKVTIGGRVVDNTRQFIGRIDEAKIFNKALTSSEVLSEYDYRGSSGGVITLPDMPSNTASITYVISVTNTGNTNITTHVNKATFTGEYI